MARKTITGLYEKGGVWHIDKVYKGERIRESTGTGDREEAEQYLIHRLEQLRQQKVYGVRRTRTWEEAATRFLMISGEAVAGPNVQTIFARRTIFPNQRLPLVYRLQEAIALVWLDVRAV